MICQVEDKYMANVCESQLMMWDQYAVLERIRLEGLVASSLALGQSRCLRTVGLDSPLLVNLLSEDEVLTVLSRPEDCAKWGLGLVRTEDNTSIIILDTPTASPTSTLLLR